MVKHVYYKKQAIDSTCHFRSKMEAKQEALAKKREKNHARYQQRRKESLMVAYIRIKHHVVYKEAEKYYTKINQIYPNKLNLLKTPRFKELQQTEINDTMQLRIPLISSRESQQNIPPPHPEASIPTTNELSTVENPEPSVPTTSELSTVEIPEVENPEPGIPNINQMSPIEIHEAQNLEALTPTIDAIPQDIVDSIISSLRADPDLNQMMNEIESEIIYEDQDIDIDVEIASDLLEKELTFW